MSRREIRFWWIVYFISPVMGIAGLFLYRELGL